MEFHEALKHIMEGKYVRKRTTDEILGGVTEYSDKIWLCKLVNSRIKKVEVWQPKNEDLVSYNWNLFTDKE